MLIKLCMNKHSIELSIARVIFRKMTTQILRTYKWLHVMNIHEWATNTKHRNIPILTDMASHSYILHCQTDAFL